MNTTQIPFDATTLARSTNPATSHAAAQSCRELRDAQHRTILEVMGRGYAPDWTADEIAEWCALDRHQIGRRLNELERHRLIRRTANKRPTPSGRMAQCWEVSK